ncbi:MAG: phosphoribosyltransferase [Rhodocyclaceae bacterium]|nr:MAG: phosphoribosyltransferase [Rhodocyclaceae bacterium]
MSIAASAVTNMASGVKAAANRYVAALLPQDCFLCAAPSGKSLLCAACTASLPRLTMERCPVCALPTPDSNICGACLGHAPHFDATQAVFRYEFPVDSLIQALKYAHRLASADFLGRELAQMAAPLRPDLILPVPLSQARLAQRGFNQAVEIAAGNHSSAPLPRHRAASQPALEGAGKKHPSRLRMRNRPDRQNRAADR